ncbi:DUF1214 domain-containing protein [Streptomyces lateritius]|uniref:DUF1214 domain-containing protein n=1 Tax=Streptomyces lateritius TaxID=67313 RepID=A0ABW6YBZ0_9ACTN
MQRFEKRGVQEDLMSNALRVNVDNFVRAETDRMFDDLQRAADGVNTWSHNRTPTPIDQQPVIRMNRDTLYSFAVVDVSRGATLGIPDTGDRYISAMVVNQDHYVNRIFREPGEYELTVEEFDTPFVVVALRVLVDPADSDDLAAVSELQDRFGLTAVSDHPFEPADYDEESLTATRQALLELAKGLSGVERAFGRREAVDPVRHLIGTAAGWGGLPETEASYITVNPGLPVGEYELTVRDVPVDAFWSISLYNADGFFQANDRDAYSVNSVTGVPNDDGSITVRFGGCADGRANCLPVMEGWNYLVRLYRPHQEILDGSWTFPTIDAGS